MSVQSISSPLNAGQYIACNSAIDVIKNRSFEEIRNSLKSGIANFQEMEDGQTLLNLFCDRKTVKCYGDRFLLELSCGRRKGLENSDSKKEPW